MRKAAVELSAQFAKNGEDPAISVARADLIYDFISGAPRQYSQDGARMMLPKHGFPPSLP
jgi:hypothetical protein